MNVIVKNREPKYSGNSGPMSYVRADGAHFTHGYIPVIAVVLWSFHLYTPQTHKKNPANH